MGRLIVNSNRDKIVDTSNLRVPILVSLIFIILLIISIYKLGIFIHKTETEYQIQTTNIINSCECAKHRQRDVVPVSGIISGHIKIKTVIVCKNGKCFN